jgi:hypothetical protein
MPNIQPEGEKLRRAVKWISEQIQQRGEVQRRKIIEEAVIRFDLSPKDSEFVVREFGEVAK